MWISTIGVALKWLWLYLQGLGQPFVEVIALSRPLELCAERRLFLAFVSGVQVLAAYPLLRRLWAHDVASVAIVLMAIEPVSF